MSATSIAHTTENNNTSSTLMKCLLIELDRREQIALYWVCGFTIKIQETLIGFVKDCFNKRRDALTKYALCNVCNWQNRGPQSGFNRCTCWENIPDENCDDCGRYGPYCNHFPSFPSKEWEATLSKERVTETSVYKSFEDSLGYNYSDDTIPWRWLAVYDMHTDECYFAKLLLHNQAPMAEPAVSLPCMTRSVSEGPRSHASLQQELPDLSTLEVISEPKQAESTPDIDSFFIPKPPRVFGNGGVPQQVFQLKPNSDSSGFWKPVGDWHSPGIKGVHRGMLEMNPGMSIETAREIKRVFSGED